jgi:hypothetical protein
MGLSTNVQQVAVVSVGESLRATLIPVFGRAVQFSETPGSCATGSRPLAP